MKKLISLLLVLCLACTAMMISCAKDPATNDDPPAEKPLTPAEQVSEAIKKIDALSDIDFDMNMDIKMNVSGTEMEIPVKMNYKIKGVHAENPVIYNKTEMTMMGETMVTETYVEGEWAYMVMDDIKYKMKAEDADMDISTDDMLKDLPEEIMKTAETVENADGSITMKVSVPADKFGEIFDEMIEGMNSSMGGSEVDEIKLNNASVETTIKDGYVISYIIGYDMEMSMMGETVTAQATASITFNNVGKEVTITFPEGYKDFEEVPMY